MYVKTVKTVSANHISHTYKKGTVSLHVPGSGRRARAGPGASTGGPAAQRGSAGRESSEPRPGRGRPHTEGSCSGRGVRVRGPLCAQTCRPEQRGCQGAVCPGTKDVPPSFPRAGVAQSSCRTTRLSSPSKPSPGAGMWHPGQNSARTFLTLTSGSTPNTRPERAKERSSYLN